MRVCSVPNCPRVYPDDEGSRCAQHRKQADRQRGTASDRGYNTAGHQAFRRAVLTRDPICRLCHLRVSTVADHYPVSRKDIIRSGGNPNDPAFGRGLCALCHNSETAHNQPGGWNA